MALHAVSPRGVRYNAYQRQSIKSEELMAIMNAINRRYSQGSSYIGSQGSATRWKMRQEYLSPAKFKEAYYLELSSV